ncbi:MAG: hypothetical protein WCJ64_12545 [Rhodospirillaceae bacterium]
MGTYGTDSDDDLEYHPPTREEVFAQLEDWRRRLHALYADIISWLPAENGYETEIRDYMTDESPMRVAGVPPQPVPELRVYRHSQLYLTFTPEACWIIGAGGQLRVKTATTSHELYESTSPFVEPGWRLIRRNRQRLPPGRPVSARPPGNDEARGLRFDKTQVLALMEPAHG